MKKTTLLLAAMMLTLSGCLWDIPEPLESIDSMAPVSFSEKVLPVLVRDCTNSGCHGTGDVRPIMTAEVAYEELMSMDGMINVENPTRSVLYERMVSAQRPMPPSGLLPDRTTHLILAWITQGASDE